MAILQDGPERRTSTERIEDAATRAVSAATLVECSIVLEARFGPAGVLLLDRLLEVAGVRVVPLDADQARIGREAHHRFGKGRHPAGRDLGDCCAYAARGRTRGTVAEQGRRLPCNRHRARRPARTQSTHVRRTGHPRRPGVCDALQAAHGRRCRRARAPRPAPAAGGRPAVGQSWSSRSKGSSARARDRIRPWRRTRRGRGRRASGVSLGRPRSCSRARARGRLQEASTAHRARRPIGRDATRRRPRNEVVSG
jgi:ribonuclease VapC